MASLRKKWQVLVRPGQGRNRSPARGQAVPDKSVARIIKRTWKAGTQRSGWNMDPGEPSSLKAERIPITVHAAEYVALLAAKGRVPEHVAAVRRRLSGSSRKPRSPGCLNFTRAVVDVALKVLRDAGRRLTTRSSTSATRFQGVRQWLRGEEQANQRPTSSRDWIGPRSSRSEDGNALTPEQATRLVATTRTGKFRAWDDR